MYKQAIKRGKYYHARIRIHPTDEMFQQSLRTTDKEVAEKKLNKLARQMERETEGLATPTKMKQAAQLPLGKHLRKYLVAREAEWTDKTSQTSNDRLKKMLRECGWNHLRDIDAPSFQEWRSQQSLSLNPKTLNDYLSVLNQFLNWLADNRFLESNPLAKVKRLQKRGRTTFTRRALPLPEIAKLLDAVKEKPTRRAAYLAAIYTGLRRTELEKLEWGDVILDSDSPYLAVRASTTKSGKDATLPLHPALLQTLRALKPAEAKATDKVLTIPTIETYREDLKRAGIEYMNSRNEKADFHALRHTYGTLMQIAGVNPRTAQELMRHSDMKLTMQIYTDANLLPKVAAIHSLPDLTNVTPAVTSDMTICDKASLSLSQDQEGSTPLSINDMAGLGMLSPAVSQEENGARGGSRTQLAPLVLAHQITHRHSYRHKSNFT
ncbi:MAG: site-specific integrase [Pontiella sp.]